MSVFQFMECTFTDDERKPYYILILNDMRSSQIQTVQAVCRAQNVEEIKTLLERERVPYYEEPKGDYHNSQWGKNFRKGGPLEWFNLPHEWSPHIVREHSLMEAVQSLFHRYQESRGEVPDISTLT